MDEMELATPVMIQLLRLPVRHQHRRLLGPSALGWLALVW